MVYLPLEKLVGEYFLKPDLQEACRIIDAPTSYPNEDLEEIILDEWEDHGLDKYELLRILDRPKLVRICKAYNIDPKGNQETLLKRMKKVKLLDNSHTNLKITGGVGGGALLFVLLTIGGFGLDLFDFVETRILTEALVEQNSSESLTGLGNENSLTRITQMPLNEEGKYGLLLEFYTIDEPIPGVDITIELSSEYSRVNHWFDIPEQVKNQHPGGVEIGSNFEHKPQPKRYDTKFAEPIIFQWKSFYIYFESDEPVEVSDYRFEQFNPNE